MEPIYMYSLVSMGGLGALLAVGLGFAAKSFQVDTDERVEKIEEILPGANCGACGYAGCGSFASAVVSGEGKINGCTVGGNKVAEKIADILGKEASATDSKIAHVLCKGGVKETKKNSDYRGVETCKAVNQVNAGTKACSFSCLGYGDCVAACPFDAIELNENGLPVIDEEKCTGCGKCVKACPKNIIILAPEAAETHIKCSSHEPGKVVRKICEVGCIGCGLCSKTCPVEAITMENNLAVIDYEKCINCGLCAEKCPTGTIAYNGNRIKKVQITDDCVGCTLCQKACPVEAISGEVKEKHEIDEELCIKCGICCDTCNVDAVKVEYKDEE